MKNVKRAAAYLRTSTEERLDGWGLGDQEQQIRAYAAHNGYEIVQVYQDELPDTTSKRLGFEQMMLDAREARFSSVLVAHPSRLFRNVALAHRCADDLRARLGVEVLFVQDSAAAVTSLTDADLTQLFEEYSHHQFQLRTTLGKQMRARNGLYNGILPFGYVKGDGGIPIAHPIDSVGLIMAFEEYSTGRYTDAQIAEMLNDKGYRTTGNWGRRPFTKDTVNRMLQNTFYLGTVKYKKGIFPGQHPALINQGLFNACQEVRAHRHSQPTRSINRRIYILAGIARCSECELTLRGVATQSKGQWRYYRHTARERGFECSVPAKMVRADALEQQWGDMLSAVRVPVEWEPQLQAIAANADLHLDVGHLNTLGDLWAAVTLEEQRTLTRLLLKALYVDVLHGTITAIEPQPDVKGLFLLSAHTLGVDVR